MCDIVHLFTDKLDQYGFCEEYGVVKKESKQNKNHEKRVAAKDYAKLEKQFQKESRKRHELEKALQESEQRYKVIIEKSSEAIFFIEAEGPSAGKIISVNQAAAEIHGYSFDELLTLHIGDLTTAESVLGEANRFQRILAGEWIKEEISHKKKDGSPFPVEISAGLLEIDKRKYILEFERDISEQKRAESDLVLAQKNEALGTLAGGIAHDFNNILGTIIGYAEMIQMFDLTDNSPLHPKVHEIIRAAYRAKKLTQQILTFSSRFKEEKSAVKIDPIIREVLGFMKAIQPPSISIQYNNSAKSGTVLADSTQMHQVLMNLCTNAMHAMQELGGVLHLILEEIEIVQGISSMMLDLEPGKYIKLTISDTGAGMAQDVLERVFDPYYTTKEKGEGTGMGLAVVQGIVKNHGGTITAESGEGVGSVFQVYLPASDMVEAESPAPQTSHTLSGNGRILFVDDEQSLLDISKETMEKYGHHVTTSGNGLEALEIFRQDPGQFDLVITDQVMPRMKGDQLAREILKIRPDLPVVLCTGFSESITEQTAEAIGICKFLYKPVGAAMLAELVREILVENCGKDTE